MEPRFRRAQPGAPLSGRNLPGMPLEMSDPDEDTPRRGFRRELPKNSWWRPKGTWGRVLLVSCAFLIVCGVAFAYHTAKMFLDRDARFRIAGSSAIQASGLAEVTRAQLLPVFGEDIGRNIFFVPIAERRKQLEQIPWIQKATVMRLLPDQIRVSVVERQPIAFVRHGQQIGLVDANGVLLDMPAAMLAQHHYSFPVVTGIDAGDPVSSRRARMALYQHLLGDLDSSGHHYSDQVSEIDLTDPEDARVLMPAQGTDILAHFGEDHFLARYERYKAHIGEWRQQYPKLAEVDLRYDQQVVLEMTPHAANAMPAALHEPDEKPAAGEPAKPSPVTTAAPKPQNPHAPVKASAPVRHAPSPKAITHANSKAAARLRAEQKAKAKKRAEAKRAALNHSKTRKTTLKAKPVTPGQGE
ncbi:MAG TPA: FtsQ-type POTRA domain-containing protein [Terracidiphilus sp.]|nr:FtsQ-type POTRA domain-containing protein [Terracidiphilus sp.]